jgi:uncharacterized coiled-coil DUF342 family protein
VEPGLQVALAGLAGAAITGFFGWLQRRGETGRQAKKDDAEAKRDIASIVNQQVEIVFKYWKTIFDEREEEVGRLLGQAKELMRERDQLGLRVRELGQEVEDVKRKRRQDQETIAQLRAEIEALRRASAQ